MFKWKPVLTADIYYALKDGENRRIIHLVMIYFKIVTPENYCCEFFHIIGIGKRSAPCYQKSSLFFSHVKWCNAIGHNVTGILNLAWAVTSEPMKIKSRLAERLFQDYGQYLISIPKPLFSLFLINFSERI